jgi:hypothetical protein
MGTLFPLVGCEEQGPHLLCPKYLLTDHHVDHEVIHAHIAQVAECASLI